MEWYLMKKEKSNKNNNQPSVHIGKVIQSKVNTSGLTISEFAEKIHMSRPAVYQMFKKQSIDSDLLVRISLLLKENFVKYIYQEVECLLQEEKECETNELNKISLEQSNKVLNKLEVIHQDLISIKNILIEIKEVKL